MVSYKADFIILRFLRYNIEVPEVPGVPEVLEVSESYGSSGSSRSFECSMYYLKNLKIRKSAL